ncbi:hypothetical protein NM688_g946 [Phlebia brevispora]|uniref:Uncharacterized protein n=1 Tax=Phlebia brevispora TaxID=194682 RepID=A0ACC1TDM7_9APHY|nr:hypothetical protein NM688_g946 [Phlebia brevispora]
MYFRSILTAVLLSALAPTVRGCVSYSASGSFPSGQYINAQLIDNGELMCWYTGDPGSDGLYRFTCIAGNVACIVNTSGWVEYANPHGNFAFQATYSVPDPNPGSEFFSWEACEYDCSPDQCSFV